MTVQYKKGQVTVKLSLTEARQFISSSAAAVVVQDAVRSVMDLTKQGGK